VISDLANSLPEMIVGAGTVLDVEMAQRCVDAGAKFLTSAGLVPEVVEFATNAFMNWRDDSSLESRKLAAEWRYGSLAMRVFVVYHELLCFRRGQGLGRN